jgi:hypothetical protein
VSYLSFVWDAGPSISERARAQETDKTGENYLVCGNDKNKEMEVLIDLTGLLSIIAFPVEGPMRAGEPGSCRS